MKTRLIVLLKGLTIAGALARPLPQIVTYLTDPVALNRATRQLTTLRPLPRPAARPMTVGLTLVTPTISFMVNSVAAYNGGVLLANQNTLNVTNNTTNGTYTVAVRSSSDNLTSGVNTIPASQVGIQLTYWGSTPVNAPEVRLNSVNQTLGSYLNPTIGSSIVSLYFNYHLYGGALLFKPSGTYSTTLTFTVTGP